MAFVVDGAQWRFDHLSSDEIATQIESVLERVSTAREREEVVWIGDDLQTRAVFEEFDLWSLFSPEAPLSLNRELCDELAGWLSSAPRYADERDWPDGATNTFIQIDREEPSENADVAWAHHDVRAGRAVACLSLFRRGPYQTASDLGMATIHWVVDEPSHRAFWRAAIDVEGDSEMTLQKLSSHAFPDLYFHPPVWRGFRDLDGGYRALSGVVRQYLSVLDDTGAWAFNCSPPYLSPAEENLNVAATPPSNQLIERRFLGFGLTMAPENPNVYADARCREAREIKLGTRILYCEWHAKLEPHRNRIHVHAPVPESNNKVVIAVVHPHLRLPGDA